MIPPKVLKRIEELKKKILGNFEKADLDASFETKNITIKKIDNKNTYNMDMVMSSYWIWQGEYRNYTSRPYI